MWMAASLGHSDIVSVLIHYGADLEARDNYYGMIPYMRASHQNKVEVMKLLVEAGADTLAEPD